MKVHRSEDPTAAALSVIVVTWNCAATLDACLASLAASEGPPAQVICVDNGSTDGSAAIAERHGAEVVRIGWNSGFPHAVNVALPSCRGELVLLLNPDVVLGSDTIARCLDALRDSTVGLVGANLRRPDGRPDLAAARRFRTLGLLAIETFGLAHLVPRLDRQYLSDRERQTTRDVPCINGAFALVRRDLLTSIGGLDETVFLYLEDQQLCRDVAARGLRVRFVSDALATHMVSAATFAARADQQHAAYLHRIDANVELIRRIQGRWCARAAIGLWLMRVTAGVAVSMARRDVDRRRRYALAARWLMGQSRRRTAPPPVPD